MIAMAEPKTRREQSEFERFLDSELPPNIRNFPVWWLAKFWQTSTQQVWKLIKSGALGDLWDLRDKGSTRASYRVPRPAVVKFMRERKDLQAVSEANASPKPRERKRVRKPAQR